MQYLPVGEIAEVLFLPCAGIRQKVLQTESPRRLRKGGERMDAGGSRRRQWHRCAVGGVTPGAIGGTTRKRGSLAMEPGSSRRTTPVLGFVIPSSGAHAPMRCIPLSSVMPMILTRR